MGLFTRRGRAGTGQPTCRTSTTARIPAWSDHAYPRSAPARHPAPSSARQAHRDPTIAPWPDIMAQPVLDTDQARRTPDRRPWPGRAPSFAADDTFLTGTPHRAGERGTD